MHYFEKKRESLNVRVKNVVANQCTLENPCKNGGECYQSHSFSTERVQLTGLKTIRSIPVASRHIQ